jgi:hypothetical protein
LAENNTALGTGTGVNFENNLGKNKNIRLSNNWSDSNFNNLDNDVELDLKELKNININNKSPTREEVKSDNIKIDNKKPQLEFNNKQSNDRKENQFSIGFTTEKNINEKLIPNKKYEMEDLDYEDDEQDQTSIVNYNNINTEVNLF